MTDNCPWVTAAAVTLTVLLMTTVPVREFTTTRALGSPGITSRFSTKLRKETLAPKVSGAITAIEVPSTAVAVPSPNCSLMTSDIAVAVVKSF